MTLHLDERQYKIVLDILKAFIPNITVWAFGSRIKGTHRQYSDLDLALISDNKIPLSVLIDLKEAFTQSDLDIKIDIIDFKDITPDFQKIIQQEHIVLQD